MSDTKLLAPLSFVGLALPCSPLDAPDDDFSWLSLAARSSCFAPLSRFSAVEPSRALFLSDDCARWSFVFSDFEGALSAPFIEGCSDLAPLSEEGAGDVLFAAPELFGAICAAPALPGAAPGDAPLPPSCAAAAPLTASSAATLKPMIDRVLITVLLVRIRLLEPLQNSNRNGLKEFPRSGDDRGYEFGNQIVE